MHLFIFLFFYLTSLSLSPSCHCLVSLLTCDFMTGSVVCKWTKCWYNMQIICICISVCFLDQESSESGRSAWEYLWILGDILVKLFFEQPEHLATPAKLCRSRIHWMSVSQFFQHPASLFQCWWWAYIMGIVFERIIDTRNGNQWLQLYVLGPC